VGTLNWSVGSLPAWVTVSPSSGSLAAGSSTPLSVSFNIPSTDGPQTYTTALTFTDPAAADSPLSLPVTVVATPGAKTWYFAEGYTAAGFDTYLTLGNPNGVAATVQVEYLLLSGSGAAPQTVSYPVAANSRSTIHVNDLLPNQSVSMVVTADVPIVAERPMYFVASYPTFTVPSGTATLGATVLGQDFAFGYLDTTAKHNTFLTILNPGTSAMSVTTDYYPAAGGQALESTTTVQPGARGTIAVNGDHVGPPGQPAQQTTPLPAGTYSARVHLSQPGLVERPLYFVDSQTGYTGAADVVGVSQPQTSWDFAEGYTDPTFSERYWLSNPCLPASSGGCAASPTAQVTATFMDLAGHTTATTRTLGPGQQQAVDVNALLGNYASSSARITADQPILAERVMSFRYTGATGPLQCCANDPGATDALGATQAGHLFEFAEGYTDYGFAEFLTLQNPDPTQAATVTVSYLLLAGAPVVRTYVVGPHTRATVFLNTFLPRQSLSLVVEANVPIVAERPMYFLRGGNEPGGTDVVGYQPPGS
jgi:hypothetical protein